MFTVSGMLMTCLPTGAASAPKRTVETDDTDPKFSAIEVHERRVDQAALDSQINAIQKLQRLLRKHRSTDREPLLLFRLGEAQRQAGSMDFRIAFGVAKKRKEAKRGKGTYRKHYADSSRTLTELIQRFPRHPDIPRAYYLRARSNAESGNVEAASADYLHLVRSYPKSDDVIPAYMALAEIAMNKSNWRGASEYLKPLERHPEDPRYPHALYRQAWCQYNLKDVPRALSYIEKNIRHYSESKQSRSDEALRENAVHDAALFFMAGYEQKLANFGVTDAYSYLRRLGPGELFGKIMVRYAKLLRAHGHAEELAEWKNLLLREEGKRPESFEVVVITYEDQLNKRQYPGLVQTAKDLVAYRSRKTAPEVVARAERLILEAAHQLQVLITRNKDADGVAVLTKALAGVYDSFVQIVDEKDPRIPKVHYNLAESYFEIGQFEQATTHYRWVVEHGAWRAPNPKDPVNVQAASLRAIASRYELLRKRNLVPGDLKAKSIKEVDAKELDSKLSEWIGWIATHIEKTGKSAEAIDSFYFEANRCIYAHGDLRVALQRLHDFALRYPKSKYASPSATLVVDTYVASAEWEKLHELASEFLAVKEWKGSPFAIRLYELASNARFKSLESSYKAGEYASAIEKAEQFLSEYPESKRKADCLAIAGHAALSAKDRPKALGYFGQLMRSAPGTEAAASALLAEGSIHEEQLNYAAAGRTYRQYLSQKPELVKIGGGPRKALRRKVVTFAWMSGDQGQLRSVLNDQNVCADDLSMECERYRTLDLFQRASKGPEFTAKAFARARRGPVELRAIWAALALEGARHLAFRDRHVAIRILTRHLQDLDALTRTQILPSVIVSIPRAIALNRQNIRSVAPLHAREAYIVRRLEALREIENAAMEAAKLPWIRIRATVTNELADIYADSARSLNSLRGANPAIAEPFAKKADLLRGKAFQLASAGAIEAEAFDAIAQPYLHADPKRLATLLPKTPIPPPEPLDPSRLDSVNPDGEWSAKETDCDDLAKCVQAGWYRSARQKRWAEATYLLQYAREKKVLQPGTLGLLRAYTLAGLGAQAEALAELASIRDEMSDRTRKNVNRLLLGHYQSSLARERADKLIEELRKDGESVANVGWPNGSATESATRGATRGATGGAT